MIAKGRVEEERDEDRSCIKRGDTVKLDAIIQFKHLSNAKSFLKEGFYYYNCGVGDAYCELFGSYL